MKSFFHKQELSVCYLACFALGLIFFSLKLLTIVHYGSVTPYWDQWDAEAANLYKPWLEGAWTLQQFFVAHNEHHILMTRLLALLLLKLNGLWNPLLQMAINALLHVTALMIAFLLLLRVIGKKMLVPFFLFAGILFAFPYGWENTLVGFQSQFYFVILFSIITLFLLIEKEPWSPYWLFGIISGALAFFSLASGIFALAVVVVVFGIQYFLNVDRSWKKIIASFGLLFLVVLGIIFTPTIAGHAVLKAHSLKQFFHAFINIMSWPLAGNLFWFFFRNAPSMLLCYQLFSTKPSHDDRRWFLLGFVIWTGAQAASIAYGRAEGCMSSRYLDLFSLSVFVNFACLLSFYPLKNFFQKSIVVLWSAVILIALACYCHKELPGQLAEKRRTEIAQTLNLQRYQCSGDINDLKNKPFQEIPYPDPNRLAEILSSPTIQKILPVSVRKNSSEDCWKERSSNDGMVWFYSRMLFFVGFAILVACSLILFTVLVLRKE